MIHLQVNPIPEGQDQIGFDEPLPPVPEYKEWVDPVEKSEAFAQLDALFEQRIGMIDGAMGTNIQEYKLDESDYRGERYKVRSRQCVAVRPVVVVPGKTNPGQSCVPVHHACDLLNL
jgi:hypothetical protein